MWNVAAFDKGEWGRLSVFESTGVPPSTGLAIGLAENYSTPTRVALWITCVPK
jgi:hypothetical protein